MGILNKKDKDALVKVLEELIGVIATMRTDSNDYLLMQNEYEAREWISYLKTHDEIEEIYSLKKEIVDRFVGEFDVQICENELDDERVQLMKSFIILAGKMLNKTKHIERND